MILYLGEISGDQSAYWCKKPLGNVLRISSRRGALRMANLSRVWYSNRKTMQSRHIIFGTSPSAQGVEDFDDAAKEVKEL